MDSQTDELVTATTAFVAAIKAGDIAAAKAQYPTTRTYYERIEPVAESFPDDLDPRIDLREADLEPGQKWTGFHRLEKDLWVSGLQPDTNAIADQLLADIKELNQKVKAPEYTIDSTQIAGGAQGLLDEVAASKITGEEDIFSHTDLWDFYANVEGSRTAVGSVRPILDERDAELGKRVDQRFEAVDELLDKYRKGDGFVLYDTVTEPAAPRAFARDRRAEQGGEPGAGCHRSPVTRTPLRSSRSGTGLSRRKLFGAAGVTAAVVGAAGAGALAGRASAADARTGELDKPVPFRGAAPGRASSPRPRTGCTSPPST